MKTKIIYKFTTQKKTTVNISEVFLFTIFLMHTWFYVTEILLPITFCFIVLYTTEWERLEISSRKLEIPREYFMQKWAQ